MGTRGQEEVLLVTRKPSEQERSLWSQKKPTMPHRPTVCDAPITQEEVVADVNQMFARLGVSHLSPERSDTYSHPRRAGVIG